MRRYYLASVEKRGTVDLREYEDKIMEAVKQIIPSATVVVEKDCYSVHPTPERGNAIRIGRLLSNRNVLGQHCIQIPKLFCSEEVENGKEVEDGTEKKRIGGHQ